MATVFDKLWNDAIQRGMLNGKMKASTDWFRAAASQTEVTPGRVISDVAKSYGWTLTRSNLSADSIGRMYLFNYDPKLKKKLPYYDRYPLIFPIAMEKDNMLGINLHYISPKLRAILMDNLQAIATNDKYDAKTKLAITYGLLKNTSKFRYYKPCIKRYLFSHVKSNFMLVPAKHWDIAMFLPLARFEKASESQVFKDSNKIISG